MAIAHLRLIAFAGQSQLKRVARHSDVPQASKNTSRSKLSRSAAFQFTATSGMRQIAPIQIKIAVAANTISQSSLRRGCAADSVP